MYNIAILSYNSSKYSETFIHQLMELPFHVHFLSGGELPAYKPDGTLFLPDEGVNRIISDIQQWFGYTHHQQHVNAIARYFRQHHVKAVLANYAITAFPIMQLCKDLDIPLIVHFHGWTAYRRTILEQYATSYKMLFALATKVVCVSNDMKRQLVSLGCPSNKLEVLPTGADTRLFQFADRSTNEALFFSAGRFCDTKNPHLTILAFSYALKELPHLKLEIAGGDENLLCASVNLVKALGIENAVTFLGILTPQQIYQKMSKALAYVQHSATTILDEKEGTPCSIMEASACGLPVIATRHAGINDVVLHGETGLLCDELDIQTMAQHMVQLVNDRALAKRMGEKGAAFISQYFTRKQYLDKLTNVLLQAIERNS